MKTFRLDQAGWGDNVPKLVISEMLGINTTTASLQLPEGEFSNLQNIRGRPFQNLVKREGVEFVSSQNGPVMGIFDFDLDGITIPLTISAGTLTFFPSTASIDGSLPEMDPFAMDDPLDPSGARLLIFAIEPTMRALQERREAPGHSTWSWPNRIFGSDGNRLNGNTGVAVADYPATDLYVPDLLYHDSFYGNPAGTRAASLINNIIDAAINTMGLSGGQDWIKTINAVSSIVYYDTSIFPTASSATPSNYRSKLAAIKSGIQKLTTINVPATQVNVESKQGEAEDSAVGCDIYAASYSIVGYSDSMFANTAGTAENCGDTNCNPCLGAFSGTFANPDEDVTVCRYFLSPATLSSNACVSFNSGQGLRVDGILFSKMTVTKSSGNSIIHLDAVTDPPDGDAYIEYRRSGSPVGVYTLFDIQNMTGPATITVA